MVRVRGRAALFGCCAFARRLRCAPGTFVESLQRTARTRGCLRGVRIRSWCPGWCSSRLVGGARLARCKLARGQTESVCDRGQACLDPPETVENGISSTSEISGPVNRKRRKAAIEGPPVRPQWTLRRASLADGRRPADQSRPHPAESRPGPTLFCRFSDQHHRTRLAKNRRFAGILWREADLNRRHRDFQSRALPAELSRRASRSYRLRHIASPSQSRDATPNSRPTGSSKATVKAPNRRLTISPLAQNATRRPPHSLASHIRGDPKSGDTGRCAVAPRTRE
jgi:hypothetical protein